VAVARTEKSAARAVRRLVMVGSLELGFGLR